jgi:hypothetical protein
VELAQATVLRRWTRSEGWLSGAPHCTWLGISCDASGDVTALELDLNQLAGLMPASLGRLSALRTLCVFPLAHAQRETRTSRCRCRYLCHSARFGTTGCTARCRTRWEA